MAKKIDDFLRSGVIAAMLDEGKDLYISNEARQVLQDKLTAADAALAKAGEAGITAIAAMADAPEPAVELDEEGACTVNITGVLVRSRRTAAMLTWCGITASSYVAIRANIDAAIEAGAKQITLFIDTPGGDIHGMEACARAIYAARKQARVVATCEAALSAGYVLAAQAKKIEAIGETALFGSLGLKTEFIVTTDAAGYKKITFTDKGAPHKAPNPDSAAGKKTYTDMLDNIAKPIREMVAQGRGTTLGDVEANYGKGAVLVARQAMDVKMIDKITHGADGSSESEYHSPAQMGAKVNSSAPVVDDGASTDTTNTSEDSKMDEQEKIKAAAAEAAAAAEKAERVRCTAIMQNAGHSPECLKAATEAIASGEDAAVATAHIVAQHVNRISAMAASAAAAAQVPDTNVTGNETAEKAAAGVEAKAAATAQAAAEATQSDKFFDEALADIAGQAGAIDASTKDGNGVATPVEVS